LTVPQTQGTADHPALEIYAAVKRARHSPGILAASVAMGFPYSDRDDLGVAVLAYGDAEETANAVADELASEIWRARHDFVPRLESPKDAISVAERSPGTTILVDVADNVGGGAPGDGTVLLDALVARAPIGAAVVIWDPISSAHAASLGVGARFSAAVGGRADHLHGAPVEVAGVVTFAGHLRYERRSSYMTGQIVDLGQVAVIDCDGVMIMLTERRAMPFDSDHLRAAGIAPATCSAVVVKSAIAWKAGFGSVASRHVFVDTPGICSSNLSRFTYKKGAADLFPLNLAAKWP
jgi:microcystin degradation protein MlrC